MLAYIAEINYSKVVLFRKLATKKHKMHEEFSPFFALLVPLCR